jgi:hypothetical protein
VALRQSRAPRPLRCHPSREGYKASFDLAGNIIVGELPRRQLRLVQAWTELHAEELDVDWQLAIDEKPLNPIDPLR